MTGKARGARRVLVIVATVFALAAPASAALAGPAGGVDDGAFAALRERRAAMLTGGQNYDPSDPHIAARIAEMDARARDLWERMNAEHTWDDLDPRSSSRDMNTGYLRLFDMALAWDTKGSELEGDPGLLADIVAGMQWQYENVYNPGREQFGNWFHWEIHAPWVLADITILLYDELTQEQVGNWMGASRHFSPRVRETGSERARRALVVGLRGIASGNADEIAESSAGLSPLFDYVPPNQAGEGFYRDGTFRQHWWYPYNGHYGLGALRGVGNLMYLYDGSPWEVTDPDAANVFDWVYDAFEPYLYKGGMMDAIQGRAISRARTDNHLAGHGLIRTVAELARIESAPDDFAAMVKGWMRRDPYRELFYQRMDVADIVVVKRILADDAVPGRDPLVGNFQFYDGDRVVHRRPGWAYTITMSSKRIHSYESLNGENLHGWYTGDGMTYLYTDGTAFDDAFWPTVDPYRMPGTTVDTRGRADASGRKYGSPQAWTGGVSLDGTYGTAGMELDAWGSSLAARKSWFLFDDEVVALGAGITSADGRPIETVITNRKLNDKGDNALTVDGRRKPWLVGPPEAGGDPAAPRWSETMRDADWAHLEGTGGYYFPGGATVHGLREARTGTWRDINIRGPEEQVTRNYMAMWFDHGKNPDGAKYSYVTLPEKDRNKVKAYAADPDIQVVANTPEVAAVEETTLGITTANFWTDDETTVGPVTAHDRASVAVRDDAGKLTVAVSDPTHENTGGVDIDVDRSATAVAAKDDDVRVTRLQPTIGLRLCTGLEPQKGSTNQVSLRTGSGEPADGTAPARVSDLSAAARSDDTVTLGWTAPGDDGAEGTASSYQIRYATEPITADTWDEATPVEETPCPTAAGGQQQLVLRDLRPDTTYHFALRTGDEVPNRSGLSNVAKARTAPPAQPFADDFDDGDADGWTPQSGSWAVENGEYSQSSLGGFGHHSTIDGLAVDDAVVEADIKILDDGGHPNRWAAVQVRKQRPGDRYVESGYMVFLRSDGKVYLFKAGAGVLAGAQTGTDPNTGFVHLRVDMHGPRLEVTVGDAEQPQITVTDDEYAFGYVSVTTGRTHAHFDNVRVSPT